MQQKPYFPPEIDCTERWSPISQPQRRLRDWSRVRSSEQQDISATGVGVETDAHLLQSAARFGPLTK